MAIQDFQILFNSQEVKKTFQICETKKQLKEVHSSSFGLPGYPVGGWVRSSFALVVIPLCTRTPKIARSRAT